MSTTGTTVVERLAEIEQRLVWLEGIDTVHTVTEDDARWLLAQLRDARAEVEKWRAENERLRGEVDAGIVTERSSNETARRIIAELRAERDALKARLAAVRDALARDEQAVFKVAWAWQVLIDAETVTGEDSSDG